MAGRSAHPVGLPLLPMPCLVISWGCRCPQAGFHTPSDRYLHAAPAEPAPSRCRRSASGGGTVRAQRSTQAPWAADILYCPVYCRRSASGGGTVRIQHSTQARWAAASQPRPASLRPPRRAYSTRTRRRGRSCCWLWCARELLIWVCVMYIKCRMSTLGNGRCCR